MEAQNKKKINNNKNNKRKKKKQVQIFNAYNGLWAEISSQDQKEQIIVLQL
jgi:hypothetical protein